MQQVYSDYGLKWEVILSQKGPSGKKPYSFRIGKGFRGVAYRDGLWLRLLSLHPDHDSAYQWAIFSTKADFVTWAKYIKKNELKDLEYTSCLMFNGKRYLIAEKTNRNKICVPPV